MSTRKIKLSQKLTLRFRDTSNPNASMVADLLGEDSDPSSSAETFNSLPDLLPYIFQSQTEPSAPDVTYLVSDCSPYKFWESCATDVVPLASQNEDTVHWPPNSTNTRGSSQPTQDSQNEEAEHWLLTGTQTKGAYHSEFSEEGRKNLKTNETDSVNEMTRTRVRENLRRVQAFSPHKSILYGEKEHNLDELSVMDIARDETACDAEDEIGKPIPFDIEPDTNVDSYLILDEEVAKQSQCEGPTDADETVENSRFSSMNGAPDGLERVEDHAEAMQSTKSSHEDSNFPKEFQKQKRSAPRRRDQPSVSINLVRKLNWLSDTGDDHQGGDQGAQEIVESKEKTAPKPRKTRRTVTVASVPRVSSKPPANQPKSRRGRKKKIHSDQSA